MFDVDSPPPYRSNSMATLTKAAVDYSITEQHQRCNSLSSATKPTVIHNKHKCHSAEPLIQTRYNNDNKPRVNICKNLGKKLMSRSVDCPVGSDTLTPYTDSRSLSCSSSLSQLQIVECSMGSSESSTSSYSCHRNK